MHLPELPSGASLMTIALVATCSALLGIAAGARLAMFRGRPRGRADAPAPISPEEMPQSNATTDPITNRREAMLPALLRVAKLTVADIMVPRDEIVGLDIDSDMSLLVEIMLTSQHTRLPVYRDNINNVLGVVHLRRLTRHLRAGELTRTDLLQLTEDPYYIPKSTALDIQLVNFQKEKKRIALVVDEYGEIQGLATLEDILEEIVGEITLERPAPLSEIHPQPDGSYVIDGLALLRDINRSLGWDLPTLGPKTLNGLVLEHLEALPENNLCLAIDDYRIETLQISDNLIRNLKITRSTPPTPVQRGHDRVE